MLQQLNRKSKLMDLLLAKMTGMMKSKIRLSDSDLMINSMPIPFKSPQVKPIIGFLMSGFISI